MFINYENDPPFEMRIGHCQSKPCAEGEVPVYADNEISYDVMSGWWFLETTGLAYNEDGSVKDAVY